MLNDTTPHASAAEIIRLQDRVAELEAALAAASSGREDWDAEPDPLAARSLELAARRGLVARRREAPEILSDYTYSLRVEPDRQLVLEWVAPGFVANLGYTAAEVMARGGLLALVPAEDQEIAQQHFQTALAGYPDHREYRLISKDGVIYWLHHYAHPVWDEAAERTLWINVSAQDITERKRAEAALRASEERYRGLFENLIEGYAYCQMIFDGETPQDWVYLGVNAAFEQVTGLRQVLGKRATEVIPGIQHSNPELLIRCGRVAQTRVPDRFETFLGATQQWLAVSAYSPQPGYFVTVLDVITVRKVAEEALRAAETKYRLLVEQLPVTVYISDLGMLGRWRYVSPNIQTLLEFTPEEWLADPNLWLRQLHPADRTPQEILEEGAYLRGEAFESTYRIQSKTGRQVWVRDSGRILPATAGQPPQVQGVMVDVTEQVQRDTARAHFLHSLATINHIIQRATDVEQMNAEALQAILEIFGGDRAWLLYPCDPAAPAWQVPLEVTRPDYPGVHQLGRDVPASPASTRVFEAALASEMPVTFGPGGQMPLPPELGRLYAIRS